MNCFNETWKKNCLILLSKLMSRLIKYIFVVILSYRSQRPSLRFCIFLIFFLGDKGKRGHPHEQAIQLEMRMRAGADEWNRTNVWARWKLCFAVNVFMGDELDDKEGEGVGGSNWYLAPTGFFFFLLPLLLFYAGLFLPHGSDRLFELKGKAIRS